jgi:hypothetical protein
MNNGPATTLFDAGASIVGAVVRLVVMAVGVAIVAGCVAALAGCSPAAHTLVKPEVVTVPVIVYKPLPSELTRACTVKPAEPACSRNGKPELCNDQLLYERNAYRAELAGCDGDKTEIRKLQPAQP